MNHTSTWKGFRQFVSQTSNVTNLLVLLPAAGNYRNRSARTPEFGEEGSNVKFRQGIKIDGRLHLGPMTVYDVAAGAAVNAITKGLAAAIAFALDPVQIATE